MTDSLKLTNGRRDGTLRKAGRQTDAIFVGHGSTGLHDSAPKDER